MNVKRKYEKTVNNVRRRSHFEQKPAGWRVLECGLQEAAAGSLVSCIAECQLQQTDRCEEQQQENIQAALTEYLRQTHIQHDHDNSVQTRYPEIFRKMPRLCTLHMKTMGNSAVNIGNSEKKGLPYVPKCDIMKVVFCRLPTELQIITKTKELKL